MAYEPHPVVPDGGPPCPVCAGTRYGKLGVCLDCRLARQNAQMKAMHQSLGISDTPRVVEGVQPWMRGQHGNRHG